MRDKAAKPLSAWIVEGCSRRGTRWLIHFTLRRTRTAALAIFLDCWDTEPERHWAFWRRRGYRLVRCDVVPVPPPDEAPRDL